MSLIDKFTGVASWCKSQFLYYLVYTPEQKAMLNRVEEVRKAGKLEQFKPVIKPYSEAYWKIKDALARDERGYIPH